MALSAQARPTVVPRFRQRLAGRDGDADFAFRQGQRHPVDRTQIAQAPYLARDPTRAFGHDLDRLGPQAGPAPGTACAGRKVGRQHVGRADEIRDEPGARAFVDVLWRAFLHDPPVVEDRHSVGHRQASP
jgi:hypothetical protein